MTYHNTSGDPLKVDHIYTHPAVVVVLFVLLIIAAFILYGVCVWWGMKGKFDIDHNVETGEPDSVIIFKNPMKVEKYQPRKTADIDARSIDTIDDFMITCPN